MDDLRASRMTKMKLPSLIAVRGFRSRRDITSRFHGRINSTHFMGVPPRMMLMVIRQISWNEPSNAFHVQIQPVINQRSWIGSVQEPGGNPTAVALFPEADLHELFEDCDVLEYVEQ